VSTATGDWLRVFSPIALTGACLAAAAGAIAAVQYVGTASNLWTTAYGRALLLKLGLFAGVVACGYRNWRRWSAVRSGEDVPKGAEVREVALALAIVLVTSVLTELAHP
jgi:putative copper export protein